MDTGWHQEAVPEVSGMQDMTYFLACVRFFWTGSWELMLMHWKSIKFFKKVVCQLIWYILSVQVRGTLS